MQQIKTDIHIAVIGDIMIDEYIYGSTERISPEAPVPIVKVNKKEYILGGCGNVVNNLLSLKAKVSLYSVVGDDENHAIIDNILKTKDLQHLHIIQESQRVTTLKSRIISAHQQVIRYDKETTQDISQTTQQQILDRLKETINTIDTIIISDYNKGVVTKELAQHIIQLANTNNIPILIDPKGKDFGKYKNATLITPNKKEASIALKCEIQDDNSLKDALTSFKEKFHITYPLITLSEDGIAILQDNLQKIPTLAREVYDVTGAGDTVISALAIALSSGFDLYSACTFANKAAAVVVAKIGSATVTLEEIDTLYYNNTIESKITHLKQLKTIIEGLKQQNKTIVFTNGCFDILHRGHASYLQKAKELGDILIVGLNSDTSVKRLKGSSRPINTQEDRAYLLASLQSVDFVVIFDEDTPYELIKELRPNILTKGADYKDKEVVGSTLVDRVELIEFVEGRSTTSIINKAKETVC